MDNKDNKDATFAGLFYNYLISQFPELRSKHSGTITQAKIRHHVCSLPKETKVMIAAFLGEKDESKVSNFLRDENNFRYWAKLLEKKDLSDGFKKYQAMLIAFIPYFSHPDDKNQQICKQKSEYKYEKLNLNIPSKIKAVIQKRFEGILNLLNTGEDKDNIIEIIYKIENDCNFKLDYFEIQTEARLKDDEGRRRLETVVCNYKGGETVSVETLKTKNKGVSLYSFTYNVFLWCNEKGSGSLEDEVEVIDTWSMSKGLPKYWKVIKTPDVVLNTYVVLPLIIPHLYTCFGFLSFDSSICKTYDHEIAELLECLAEIISYNMLKSRSVV